MFQKHAPRSSVLGRVNFLKVHLSSGLVALVNCECKTSQKNETVLMSGFKKEKKKKNVFIRTPTRPTPPTLSLIALGAFKAFAVYGG